MDKYRFESGSVYEYFETERSYVFIGKLAGLTKAEFINEYENEVTQH